MLMGTTLGDPDRRSSDQARGVVVKRSRLAVVLVLVSLLVACSSSGLRGRYMVAGTSTYGFEFLDEQRVLSRTGASSMQGTYTVDGSRVTVCMGPLCRDLRLDGDCLLTPGDPLGRYCRES
jgi:hypothetical protein